MADIRPKDLPAVTAFTAGDKLLIDGATTRAIPFENTISDQATAQGGTDNTKFMTPLRSHQQAIVKDTRVDARDYGAIGDGLDASAAANTIAIQAAIDAVASTGGTVFFPNGGDFRVSGQLNLLSRHNIKITAPGSTGALFESQGAAQLILTATGNALFALDGSEGIEISGLNLSYNNAAYIGNLIDLAQVSGSILTTGVHIHHCRIGGTTTATGANSLVHFANTLKVVIDHCFMNQASIGVLAHATQAVNCITLDDIWFDQTWGQLPIVAGGQSWTLKNCIFEPRVSDTGAYGMQLSTQGLIGLTMIGNRFDDGATLGTWVNFNNGGVQGGFIGGNFWRNGATAIDLGASKNVAIIGNTIYARESVPPVSKGTSTNITARSNNVTTDSGLNIPALMSSIPGGSSDVDLMDGVGSRLNVALNGISGGTGNAFMQFAGPATSLKTFTLPNASDTIATIAATQTLTNKTYDTAGTGNSFKINGVAASDNTGTGKVVRDTSPTLVTPALGAATATSINGANIDNLAWTAYTPTVTSGTGTITTATATGTYKVIGKTVHFRAKVTITTNGTGASRVEVTLPPGLPVNDTTPFSAANGASGVVLSASTIPSISASKVLIFDAGGVYPGVNGWIGCVGGVYDTP